MENSNFGIVVTFGKEGKEAIQKEELQGWGTSYVSVNNVQVLQKYSFYYQFLS